MPRTVLITGCSDGGLGAALAVAFHNHGDRVIATARNPSKMASLEALGIETVTLDVLSEDSIKAAVQAVSTMTNNSLDILVNNAGAGYSTPVLEASISELSKLFEINVFSNIRTAQLFLPLLRNSHAADGAMIVNNTSVASVSTVPFQGPYGASKSAMANFSEALRLELQPFNIRVIDLKTGTVDSNFHTNTASRGHHSRLKDDSLYLPGRERIEAFMQGDFDGKGGKGMPADEWAKQVVADLSRRNPPLRIWRGANANMLWLAQLLPVGALDGMLKKMCGLDIVERSVKENAGAKKTK